ncbi:MAG TPA: short-chain dehydrogenase [Thermoanaerobaculia bacterium]|nr:short-chain dehydrogenase [Thermoanaerobaculia bacterium]
MDLQGRKVLVLGGYGMVGTAVCRELLVRRPREIQIHSLREEEARSAAGELAPEAGDTALTLVSGDLFGLHPDALAAARGAALRRLKVWAQVGPMDDAELASFALYRLLAESRPDVVVDCVNTATGIAYRDVFKSAETLAHQLEEGALTPEAVETLLEGLYVPRLIRHVQVMYRGLLAAGTRAYVKIGTTGTGGMGLNIPYTHSEERPSRTLMSKSALAGAQSMLLFLMGRTPGAPQVKEIKPAAVIAWKRIAHGPIRRKGRALEAVEAAPRPLGATLSTRDESAARRTGRPYENVFVDTGENGLFALEEFSTVTSDEQMESVTPEEIAQYAVLEIEGRSTGYDVVGALDAAVLGPTYRAGVLRHHALQRLRALEEEHGVASVAFEMLGPPRISKLLYEAHLLREAFGRLADVAEAAPEAIRDRVNRLVLDRPDLANDAAAIGLPVLLDDGRLIRGVEVLVPGNAEAAPVTPEAVETWARDGWIDLRLANCATWRDRFRRIRDGYESIPVDDTSSRHVRDRKFWDDGERIQPGKVVGWILSVEEGGRRLKR